jgi:hypothetical protein
MKRIGAALVLAGVVLALAAPALATPGGENPVTLCHATASASNPYVEITVDADSAGGQNQLNGQNGHASHAGPIFDPATNASGDNWGDVIPAYSYVVAAGPDAGTTITYDGMNLSAEGLAILGNGCALPEPSPSPSPSESPSPSPTSPPPPPPPCPGSVRLGPWYGDPRVNIHLTGEGSFVVSGGVQRSTGLRVVSKTLACGETFTVGRYKVKHGHFLSVWQDGVLVVHVKPPRTR